MKKTFGIASAAAPTASAAAGPVPDLTGKTLGAASIDLDRYRDGTELPAGSGEFTKFLVPSQERKRGEGPAAAVPLTPGVHTAYNPNMEDLPGSE